MLQPLLVIKIDTQGAQDVKKQNFLIGNLSSLHPF